PYQEGTCRNAESDSGSEEGSRQSRCHGLFRKSENRKGKVVPESKMMRKGYPRTRMNSPAQESECDDDDIPSPKKMNDPVLNDDETGSDSESVEEDCTKSGPIQGSYLRTNSKPEPRKLRRINDDVVSSKRTTSVVTVKERGIVAEGRRLKICKGTGKRSNSSGPNYETRPKISNAIIQPSQPGGTSMKARNDLKTVNETEEISLFKNNQRCHVMMLGKRWLEEIKKVDGRTGRSDNEWELQATPTIWENQDKVDKIGIDPEIEKESARELPEDKQSSSIEILKVKQKRGKDGGVHEISTPHDDHKYDGPNEFS
ncbi:4359_t:CDS:2, partial [Acaulospora morrowiae]